MDFLLFEKSAIESIVSKIEFQSIEFELGKQLVDIVQQKVAVNSIGNVMVKADKGLLFIGKKCEKTFMLFDLQQCKLLEKERDSNVILLVLQKSFRTALRSWNRQPFTASERINGTKSIIFPFVFTDRRRLVIDRAPECVRLAKRGITHPLLVYKYGKEDAPRGEEVPKYDVLKSAGQIYLDNYNSFLQFHREHREKILQSTNAPLDIATPNQQVSDGGFSYLSYEKQLQKLTTTQRTVVENSSINSPIRIDGPAGTGKTASLLLRAYRLLDEARKNGKIFNIIFFTHSNSTKSEVERAFSIYENSSYYLSPDSAQKIEFTTLFNYCIKSIAIKDSQIIESDAAEAKQTQRMLIEDALDKMLDQQYKSFKPLLSKELKSVLDKDRTAKGTLISMLQHEFSIQIKGRTNGTIEEYRLLPRIKNALPVMNEKDKEFIFNIFKEYQNMLKITAVYDSDDITIQALAQWNAPIWRRERVERGYDYIFVDEMHLFNVNEQHVFHYLTKSPDQKDIPICFALDYSQAIGDRGDITQDYSEKFFRSEEQSNYKTVFRSSQQITDFCAAISASGTLMFQSDYKNPYDVPASGFTQHEEDLCSMPKLFMYNNEISMVESLKTHIDNAKRELQCKNHDIAIISFENDLLTEERIDQLSQKIGKGICLLKDRISSGLDRSAKSKDDLVLSDPYSINGLEFKCVILVGVDEGRVPQTVGVDDISSNYIRFIAFNQLYLTSSRAKYRLILIGNNLHGVSSCLRYALENNRIEQEEV